MIRCVVCDDHEALRLGVVRCLDGTDGIEVVGQAEEGDAAVALIVRRSPAVAVVDLHMPGSGGVEICRELAEVAPSIKVLVYTADDDPDTALQALEAGASGVALKAGPLRELARAVQVVASGQTYIEPTLATALLAQRTVEERKVLSDRETEVLQLLGEGLTTEGAARRLFLSPTTIRSYIESAMMKLESPNRTHAVAAALRGGLIS